MFEWDANKADDNYRKHGVRFSTEAPGVLDDDFALTIMDDESDPAEQRFVTIGMGTNAPVLVVVYT
ncbi:MAG TPA: BrnT family toxin [Bryobacteraceae bacterium]|nr:BrnT family toxin [Bryobacteraceae bacterium]